MTAATATGAARSVEELLERSIGVRARRLGRGEFAVETALSLLFLAVAVAMWLAGPAPGNGPLVLAIVCAYAVASRVSFPLGVGQLVPTQPFLVALFGVAPATSVPLLVYAGLLLGTSGELLLGRIHGERATFAGGDALHALGPAAVLLLAGEPSGAEMTAGVVLAAFGAQLAVDLASSTLREWVACGLPPIQQVRVIARVAAMDFALLPLGVLVVIAAELVPTAALLLLPLMALLSFIARDRLVGVQRAHDRLIELERERRRLQVAVRRIGDAFASNLDLDALLRIVTQAAVEALDADAGRAGVLEGRGLAPRSATGNHAALDGVLSSVEARALHRAAGRLVADGDGAALACRLDEGATLFGTLAVARPGRPFEPSERELLAYLAEQAAVAAENVQRHEDLHRQALTDELTGLANHRRFQEVLDGLIARHIETAEPGALILLDIDDFKLINDTHGHQTGDGVLRAVGRCLRAVCDRDGEPARYGGEEFGVVLTGHTLEQALIYADRLRAAVSALVLRGPMGQKLSITVSAGVAAVGGELPGKADVLAAADAALYCAKRAGKDRVAGGDALVSPGPVHAEELRAALGGNELLVEYQPIVQLGDGEVVALEALVRWRHPSRGVVGPNDFVPLAEEHGLVGPLGWWVLREACGRAAGWLEQHPDLHLTVNVSGHQLVLPDFVPMLRHVLGEAGFPADRLILELTETALLEDLERAAGRLKAVRALGVQVACDDFGTGHASLEYLLKLPLDVVKLPRQYVQGLAEPGRSRALGQGIMDLASRLGLTVVAEGIEDPAQLAALRALGCRLGQGYLFDRPLTPARVGALLGAGAAHPAALAA